MLLIRMTFAVKAAKNFRFVPIFSRTKRKFFFSKNNKKTENKNTVFSVLNSSFWPENKKSIARVVIAFSFLVLSKIIAVQAPFLFKHAIDSFSKLPELSDSKSLFLASPFFVLIGWGIAKTTSSLFYELRSAIFVPIANRAVRAITCRTFNHLHRMDLSYHLNQNSGALSKVIFRGQRSTNYIINSMIFNVLPTAFEIVLVCSLLGSNCGLSYAMVSIATMVLYSTFTLFVTKWRTRLRETLNELDNKASSKAIDTFINFETIKYFNNEKFEVDNYENCLKRYHEVLSRVQTSLSFLNWGQNFIFTLGVTTVMLMASNGVISGTMTVGDLVMVNGLLFQLSYPLNFIGSTYREIKQSIVDLRSLISLLNVVPTIREIEGAPYVRFKSGNLSFKNVKFSYCSNFNILDGLNLDVQSGKSIGIVGLSGSGKSTLLRLLYRFFNPSSGQITIDNHDITKVSLECVRRAIGVVPQDVVLFDETIFYNIAYGNYKATKEQVYAAAKKAKIHESIVKMPQGYDTQVGERGIKISGGEKQRIAIARMILKDPLIVLCDEATSSLDVDTELDLLNSIREFAREKTTIFVAHRLSSVCDVDEIMVLEEGRIVEQGSFYSLMSQPNGKFFAMWKKQVPDTEAKAMSNLLNK